MTTQGAHLVSVIRRRESRMKTDQITDIVERYVSKFDFSNAEFEGLQKGVTFSCLRCGSSVRAKAARLAEGDFVCPACIDNRKKRGTSGHWSDEEIEFLATLARQGLTTEEIGRQLERKPSSVQGKILSLGHRKKPFSIKHSPKAFHEEEWVEIQDKIENFQTPRLRRKRYSEYQRALERAQRLQTGGWSDYRDIFLSGFTKNTLDKFKKAQPAKAAFEQMVAEGTSLEMMATRLNTTERSVVASLSYYGLFDDWQEKHFDELVAAVEKLGKKLGRDATPQGNSEVQIDSSYIRRLIENHETKTVEFKQTFSINTHTGRPDVKMKHSVVKTVAAFLNSLGGNLLIGVKDDKSIVGIFDDEYKGADAYRQRISHVLRDALGDAPMRNVSVSIVKANQSEEVCLVEVKSSSTPVYCLHKEMNNGKRFYVRINADTIDLDIEEAIKYMSEHFQDV